MKITTVAAGLTMAVALTMTTALPGGAREASTTQRIAWQPCAQPELAGLDCGTLRVPVDWTRPRSGDTELSLVRRTATDQAHRIGSLLLNDGAGGSSIQQLRYALSFGLADSTMAQRFDVVAVDPRGIGNSDPTTCADRPQRAPGVTYFPRDAAQFQALVANNRALAASCGQSTLLAHLDLVSAARDMEAVRIGLGEDQLNWYGIGYSTLLGKTYAQLYPGRLRTMIADSALDDSLSPVARLTTEIRTAEESFDRFADWCRAQTSTATCALAGQDVAGRFDQLVASADRRPIPTSDPRRALSGEDIRAAVQDYLNIQFPQWPRLATAIQAARDGDATDFTVVQDKTLNRVEAQTHACLDTPPAATNYRQLAQLERVAAQLSPHLGGAVQGWSTMAGCLGWPAPAERPNTTPARNTPPALIIQSTHQSSTAYSWAFGLSRQLPGSVVLTRDGDDYSMFLFSPCVQAAMDSYLLDRDLPALGTTCTN